MGILLGAFIFAIVGVVVANLCLDTLGMKSQGEIRGKYRRAKIVACWICGFLAIIGFVSAMSWGWGLLHYGDNYGNRRMIDSVYINFHIALHDKDFEAAYSCMSPDYRKSHSLAEFTEKFGSHGERWLALEPARYLKIWGRTAELYPRSEQYPMSGPIYDFVKIGDQWYLTGEYATSLD